MSDNILFVFPDAQHDYFEDLREELERKLQGDATMVVEARNVARAKDLITRQGVLDITLIVAYIELPKMRKVAPKPSAAILLENWLRINDIKTPMVIVVPKYNNETVQQLKSSLSCLMESNDSLGDSIVDLYKKQEKPEKQLDIVLNLSDQDDASAWRYTIKCKNFRENNGIYDGKLKKMSPTQRENFLLITSCIDEGPLQNLEHAVHLLRDNLSELLFEDSNHNATDFSNDLEKALSEVGNLEQTRVQFVVDENVYPICFEAVMSPKGDNGDAGTNDYWMQHAPLIRHVSCKRNGHALFQEGQTRPLNVLIIGSNVSGSFELGKNKPLGELPNVELECADLKKYLDKLKDGGINLGDVRSITTGSEQGCRCTDIKKVLEEKTGNDRWDIVHYAGHSYYDEDTNNAYVFFKDNEGFVEPVEIEKFAESLSRTRLLILSSCTSAHKGFVFELAKNQVPAVLGYRTRIEDDLARVFSMDFFRSLFELRSVDRAFFQARKELYEKDEAHRAWTNPVLVLESVT